MVDTTLINYYINIIAKNSNCTAVLEKLDNKKEQSYQLCKAMADRLDEVIDAYVPRTGARNSGNTTAVLSSFPRPCRR